MLELELHHAAPPYKVGGELIRGFIGPGYTDSMAQKFELFGF